ncbi:PaaX family transcriptional regulator C-terminal domain-containing protein [Actinomycetes bacterium KLBMP 9759]
MTVVEADEVGVDDATGGPRPQALLLTFLGAHVRGTRRYVATSSVIDVLGRVGVSEHAARSTLSRMARRGLLDRVRHGRQVYVGLTARSEAILDDGNARIWRTDVSGAEWDGSWTLLGFSLPESWQRQRHALRARLVWAGFGPLQGGLWIAASAVDLQALGADLEAADHLKMFSARALPPTDVEAMVRDAWDLDALAARYTAFLRRWGSGDGSLALPDDFARQLVLQADWLHAIRRDPRLPAQHLPADWPAARAQELFLRLNAELDPGARRVAAEVLDMVPAPVGAPVGVPVGAPPVSAPVSPPVRPGSG